MLKTIITHTVCVLAGFASGLIFTYLTTFGLKPEGKKFPAEGIHLSKKAMVPNKQTPKKQVSEPTVSKLKSELSKSKQNVGSTKHSPEEIKQDSLKEYKKKKAISLQQTSKQAEEQSKPSAKPKVPMNATKTLKFKRLSQIKEIKLDVNLGIKEIFVQVEKEMSLGLGTKVTQLLCKGKLLKEGFLESIPQGATVSVRVRKSKSTLTEPPSTKSATKKLSKKGDKGLDFLDSVLDGLKEPPKLVAKKSQSLLPTREKPKGLITQKSRGKISISSQKRINQQLNRDILSMQKVWIRRKHGLSPIYHQGVEFVHTKAG